MDYRCEPPASRNYYILIEELKLKCLPTQKYWLGHVRARTHCTASDTITLESSLAVYLKVKYILTYNPTNRFFACSSKDFYILLFICQKL
jgi:hypothetical protein